MTNNIPQLLAKFHENLMWRFEDMAKTVDFGPFLTLIPYNLEIKIFFSKIRLEHCFTLIKLQLRAKNQNNPMNGFRDLHRTYVRTDGRTYARTDWN